MRAKTVIAAAARKMGVSQGTIKKALKNVSGGSKAKVRIGKRTYACSVKQRDYHKGYPVMVWNDSGSDVRTIWVKL